MTKVILYLLIAVFSVLVIGFGILWLLDYDAGPFTGGSMSPTINPGDLIITTQPTGEIEPGMVVGYTLLDDRVFSLVPGSDRELVIHRVISVDGDEQFFIAKGDANGEADPWQIPLSAIKCVYLFKIPYLGYLVSFISTPFYWVFLSVFLLTCFILIRSKKRKSRKEVGENGNF